ncbi:MAG: heavy-metal-associated domain-containing protein, partial [Chloroflexota bacterium]
METQTLHASAINCGHCVMHIKNAVSQLPGVSAVEGNPQTQNVAVTFDPGQVTVDRIKATMADAG